tara:strand:- start:768 stop:1712 length:945 start_codon:yes stop_codon:yes gene_type:complete
MLNSHFYHETIRRAVAVFGTLFNDISIVRKDASDNVLNIVKVPLAYGPKQKFLARIDQQEDLSAAKVAIKLPRMSFELTSLSYDGTTKHQKTHTMQYSEGKRVLGPVYYRIGFQLNIMTKNQDDALQIIEQIIPYFQPEYTVTVKQVDNKFSNDMPFVLSSISLADDYEGELVTRRTIVYTLDFESKIRFYGGVNESKQIQQVNVSMSEDGKNIQNQKLKVQPFTVESKDEPHTVTEIRTTGLPETLTLGLTDASVFVVGQEIIGTTSATVGYISAISGNDATIRFIEGLFEINEIVSNNIGDNTTILTQIENW